MQLLLWVVLLIGSIKAMMLVGIAISGDIGRCWSAGARVSWYWGWASGSAARLLAHLIDKEDFCFYETKHKSRQKNVLNFNCLFFDLIFRLFILT